MVYIYIYIYIYKSFRTRWILSRVHLAWNQHVFSLNFHTNVKDPSLSYCLHIARGRIIEYIPFQWLVGWLVEFYGMSTFVGYLTPNPFLCREFYLKNFSLAWVHSLIVKNISISSYSVYSNSSNSANSV